MGAPKCGTTALYEYLKQHPQVFMPEEAKEPNFFGSDFQNPFFIRDESAYLALFAGARSERRIGEASIWYLYSKRAASEIKSFAPAARIIIMLREPVEMLHALHSQLLFNGDEDEADFEAALAAEDDRKAGLKLPRNPQIVEALFYRDVVKYAEQVERYFNVFPETQVKVIIYDDLKQDAAKVYRETCAFLDVDTEFRPKFRVVNRNKRVRSQRLLRFTRQPPSILPGWAKGLAPLQARKDLMWKVVKAARRLNTRYEERTPMSSDLRKRLQSEFAPEVERLSLLLGRDLSHWSR